MRQPGHQYADRYPDPITGHPLQIWPRLTPDDFESSDDYWNWLDAVSRYNNGLSPPRPKPKPEEFAPDLPATRAPRSPRARRLRSKHVGIRMTERDFELLTEFSRAHAVPPGTMARILVVRAVRAAADRAADRK